MYIYYFLAHKLWQKYKHWDPERRQTRGDNIYLLALDGDIDFEPQALLLLVDLMQRDMRLGAACGRIHPTGSG